MNGMEPGMSSNSSDLLWGVLRRQWILLLFAVIVSGVVAFFVGMNFSSHTVTAHMTLSAQAMPMSRENIYVSPNPNTAAIILKSGEVLAPVIERNTGLPSLGELSRQLKVTPNATAGTIAVDLELQLGDGKIEDLKKKAIAALDDIGQRFTEVVNNRRSKTLQSHEDFVTTNLNEASLARDKARNALVDARDKQLKQGSGETRASAVIENAVTRRLQLDDQIEDAQRKGARIRRDTSMRLDESRTIVSSALLEILNSRRRQLENYGRGLTSASKITVVKAEIQKQLTQLEAELNALIATLAPAGTPAAADGTTGAESPAAPSALVSDLVAATPAGSPAAATASPTAADAAVFATESRDLLAAWIEKFQTVGRETLGELDPVAVTAIERAQAQLSALIVEMRRLDLDAFENDGLLASLEKRKRLAEDLGKEGVESQFDSLSSIMQSESELQQKEAAYGRLAQLLDQIRQLRGCTIAEYVVSSDAVVYDLFDVKSNRNKLFAFTFLGCGLVLSIPSFLIEMMRMRPTPVNVVSRRWNLPVLGIQSSGQPTKAGKKEQAAMSQHELRLMALRIQQSLFQPTGRVVLFSGLDHEESPMTLIRSLAKCFSQREESVLMIQTVPCQLEMSKHASGEKKGRPGVAEFLAGEVQEVDSMILNTGIAGIDFLPGGCTVTASEAMASSRLTTLIDQFRERYSMIMLCGPSTLHPADLQMLAARADGIVFTVNKKSLTTVYGEEVISDLIELGAPILGFADQPGAARKAFPVEKDAVKEKNAMISVSA